MGLVDASIGAGFGGREEQLFCRRSGLCDGNLGK